MSKELVIGSNRHETKVAVLEDDQVVEVYFQRANEYSLAGSIHKGRVTRVLPGMQSAFVDLGLERDTFLYVSDFFEEHEDIDTVSDEKPYRGDRRERNGNRGNSPDRRQPTRPIQAGPDATAVLSETKPAEEESEVSAVESGTPAAQKSESVTATQAPEQNGERGFRGDRRGRRSRRRRQRGRGFPENKYAQPSAGAATATEPVEETAAAPERVEQDDAELIVLPGESLAKYRNVSTAAETRRPDEPIKDYHDPEAQPGSEDAASEEELADEAEEIALSDKIFSHHEDEAPAAEEHKIEEVEHDLPGDERDSETGGSRGSSSLDEPESEALELEPTHSVQGREPSDSPLTSREPLVLDEYEVLAIKEGLSGVDEPVLDEAPQVEEHATHLAEHELAREQDIAPATPEAQPQTAAVREQGGRYLHRVSRRMRRRRGGNRFSQQSQSQEDSGSTERGTESGADGTAAAAGLAPDVRTEMHRERLEDRAVEKSERVYPSISDLLKPGQEIIVQIAKEPLGQKGARITSHVALPGRYVVFMPSVNHLGVSRKVASDEERQRLKRILQAHRPGPTGGFIVRTAGEGVAEDDIATDMSFLYKLWLDIREKAEKKPAPALLHYDLDVVQRILRDQVTDEFKAIWVDNEELYESVVTFMQRFQPALVTRVKMYTRQTPIFDAFNITQELEKALRPKVWLKSGGYIVINQTEALVAIDINTGKYVGKSNRLEDTIVKTNTEAVKEIVRQIRLRDLGGIIVVDFIDMDERKNRQKVMQALEEAMRADKAPYKILQFNDFGLVAITRKRVKQSLERTLCSPCPYCEGAGYVKSVPTVISEILVEAQKVSRAIEGNDVVLRVHPDVAKVLKASDNQYLEEIEDILKRPVLVTGDPTLHHQKFDLA
jgi:ribonuclease G